MVAIIGTGVGERKWVSVDLASVTASPASPLVTGDSIESLFSTLPVTLYSLSILLLYW